MVADGGAGTVGVGGGLLPDVRTLVRPEPAAVLLPGPAVPAGLPGGVLPDGGLLPGPAVPAGLRAGRQRRARRAPQRRPVDAAVQPVRPPAVMTQSSTI